ncbi:hypothetical protein [Lentzea sp. NPDC060358]|uniref:hypothetical protein n=1 Tax=Lentzea sp. NPDC060358 TaxID=3347103 RepID=UPI003658288C
MTMPSERHPATEGLLGSGYVVAVVRSSTTIDAHLGEDDLIYVTLPASPCPVLLGFLPQGAENFASMLSAQLRSLAKREERQR